MSDITGFRHIALTGAANWARISRLLCKKDVPLMLNLESLSQLEGLKTQMEAEKEHAEAVVKGTQSRYGFAVLDDGREIFIPPQEMLKAFPEDRVKVCIRPTKDNKTVADIEKPQLSCGNPVQISPPDTPISFTSTGTDNCGVPDVYIEEYDCSRLNGAGKRVDLSNSCKPVVFVDTMTITKSNGVGARISWSPIAEDESGNVTTKTCSVDIVNLPDQSAPATNPPRTKKLK